jgi:hypothetical protein
MRKFGFQRLPVIIPTWAMGVSSLGCNLAEKRSTAPLKQIEAADQNLSLLLAVLGVVNYSLDDVIMCPEERSREASG